MSYNPGAEKIWYTAPNATQIVHGYLLALAVAEGRVLHYQKPGYYAQLLQGKFGSVSRRSRRKREIQFTFGDDEDFNDGRPPKASRGSGRSSAAAALEDEFPLDFMFAASDAESNADSDVLSYCPTSPRSDRQAGAASFHMSAFPNLSQSSLHMLSFPKHSQA
eukprot:4476178-Karenia_brevis.AAC.1